MPEVAVKTRSDASLAAARQLFTQEVYQPELLRAYIDALKQAVARYKRTGQEIPNDLITKKGFVKLDDIIAALTQFNQTLSSDLSIKELDLNDLTHLDRLDSAIITVSGSAASPEAAQPPAPNIPLNLEELVEAHQASLRSQQQAGKITPTSVSDHVRAQNQINFQLGVVKNNAVAQLSWAANQSPFVANLAAAYGVPPEVIQKIIRGRIEAAINNNLTAVSFRLARGQYKDINQLTSYFVKITKDALLNKENGIVTTALRKAGRDPKTKERDTAKAFKNIEETAKTEIAPLEPAAATVAADLRQHPAYQSAAIPAAVASLEKAVAKQSIPPADPKKNLRLVKALAKVHQNPNAIKKVLESAFPKATQSQRNSLLSEILPAVKQLAASSNSPLPQEFTDPNSIFVHARLYPERFPAGFIDRLNKLSPEQIATATNLAHHLNISPETAILNLLGTDSSTLYRQITTGRRALGLPTQTPLPPNAPLAQRLAKTMGEQSTLRTALETQSVPLTLQRLYEPIAAANARNTNLGEFFRSFFGVSRGIQYALARPQPVRNIADSFASVPLRWGVNYAPINSFFNFISSAGNTIRQAPSFLTSPFRAVGNAISNTIINPVKTWANTQIKSGLARAGAWLAKKGLTKAAKDIGVGLVGKGAAALLAQGVPIAGQIFAAALIGGDILKFLWDHKDKVGMFLGGMFLWGQMMLGNLINLISSLGTLGLTTGIGALLGTIFIPIPFVGTAIGATAGFSLGLAINAAGGLGAALSGLGTALGSAAASLSSFIGALTAPSLVAGLGGTIATAGLLGVGVALALKIFILDTNLYSALFVPPDSGTSAPGGGPGGIFPTPLPFDRDCPQGWPVDTSQGQKYFVNQGPGGPVTHGPPGNPWVEGIDIHPVLRLDPTKHFIISTHSGIALPFYGHPAGGDGVGIVSKCAGFDFLSLYAHMSVVLVSYGEKIKPGQVIGIIGKSGHAQTWHVHYEFEEKDWTIKNRTFSNPPLMMPPYIPEEVPATCVYRQNCRVNIP